jgi:hypothetical protein
MTGEYLGDESVLVDDVEIPASLLDFELVPGRVVRFS